MHIYESGTNGLFMAGSLWFDLQALLVLLAFFSLVFWEELFRANWTLADKRRNANLSLCHVLPYGNIICKYFYVRYVTRDWAAHVKQRHYRIGRQILRWRGALVSA